VGHSLGGAIALRTAELCPDCVVGVTCLNAGGGIYIEDEFSRFRALGRYMVQLRHPWLRRLPLLDWMFWKAGTEQPLPRHWRRQRLEDFVIADAQAALGSLLESTTEEEVHHLPQVVARLRQPVYFMGGDKDSIMQPCYVRHLASFHALFMACAGGSNLVEIPDCGHLAMLEQTDWVAAKLREIVASHALASA
ncbi:MAG: alpha/beta hydrolase, partial [Synechococcales cyanobacterium CRU_2_2]|nr:alpha/beta hydrolase [Synechococcales cyanobacterium CRU_2_2]